jgi:hypothetical protein
LFCPANIWSLHICSCNLRKCCLWIELHVLVLQMWAAFSGKQFF